MTKSKMTNQSNLEASGPKILVINPNSSVSMTKKIARFTQTHKAIGTFVKTVNPVNSPPSIEGHYDGAMSLNGLLEKVKWGEENGFEGFVIACFDDTGLDACREISTGPVVGICEASVHAASMIAKNFSVVTTLPRSIPIIEELIIKYGMAKYCRKVRSANIEVLSLDNDKRRAQAHLLTEIKKAIREDKCEAIILGCAGMTDLTQWLSDETGVPVVDGVVSAVKLIEALIGAGLRTSKVGGYAKPLPKEF